MKVLFLVPYPQGVAPSQRFRFEQYFDVLEREGIEYEVRSFYDRKAWNILYEKGRFFEKVFGILRGFMRRWQDLFRSSGFDHIFIHRELTPLGPPILEFLFTRKRRVRVIYDLDDAIWLKNPSASNRMFSFLKWHSNVRSLCKWSDLVSCGNGYIQKFAAIYNHRTHSMPTTIDTEEHHSSIREHREDETFVVGWTGAHSTLPYLDMVVPVIQDLEKVHEIQFLVISDVDPGFDLKSFRFLKWNKQREISDLLHFSVGLMPLSDDPWSRGKCGFKALQYMALGIPALVSPVGVNTEIVDDGVNGFVCQSKEEWYNALDSLIKDRQKLKEMASRTRRKVVENYSKTANSANFLHLFDHKREVNENHSTYEKARGSRS